MTPPAPVAWREEVLPSDVEAIRDLVAASGFFNEAEVDIAVELAEDALERGGDSCYRFLLAEEGGRVAGYACYGHILGTQASFDLYWIAVRPELRGRGLGRRIMARTEKLVAARGGRRVYAETSSRDLYGPTRHFYESCGYVAEAVIRDFYAPGDSKVIYVKELPSPRARPRAVVS